MAITPCGDGTASLRAIRSRNVLVLADYSPGNANAIADFLYAFDRYSVHRYYYAMWPRRLEPNFDFSQFDVIVIFWSIYFPPPPGVSPSLPPELSAKLRQCSALKVLFRQDEHVYVDRLHMAMEEAGVNVMFTCVAERDHEKFYPTARLPSLRGVHTVLTGYVPEYLESPKHRRGRQPQFDIGYRSRVVPYTLGDLGREKFVICEQFSRLGPAHGFSVNISVREEDRLYGRDWLRFLRSTRFQLGTPSGASVIDFTGEIAAAATRFQGKHPAAAYSEVRRRFFENVDGRIVIDTISPRLFEYTATGNVMVLHEGDYGGLLEPDVHYIPVRKDYSNAADVFAKMRDGPYCDRVHRAAYQHLIASGMFGYRAFAGRFDSALDTYLPADVTRAPLSRATFYARRVARSRQNVIPIGGHEVTLPFHGGGNYWARRVLDGVSSRIPWLGPRFRRRGGSAFAHLRRGVITVRAVLMSPTLRRALWACWANRDLRSRVAYYDLLRELGWLSALGAMQGRLTFVVPRFDGKTGCLRLCQLRIAVRPRTFERLRRGDYNAVLDALEAYSESSAPLQIQVELARGQHGLTVGSWPLRAHVARVCPEGFRLHQFASFLHADRGYAVRILRAILEPRTPMPEGPHAIDSLLDVAARVKAVLEVARHPEGWRSILAYCSNARLRARGDLRGFLREVWLSGGLNRVQKAQAYTPEPFWLEARLEGDVLRLISHPGSAAGGTKQQREVIESAWALVCDEMLERVEWDHREVGETFSWQVPEQPWQSVKLGTSGVQTFHAVMLWEGWWKLVGGALHIGSLSPPPQLHRIRFRLKQGVSRLRVLTGVAHTADGLRLLSQFGLDPRMRARVSFPEFVREVWLWMALTGVQQARAFAPQPFWLEPVIDGTVLRLVSHAGVSPGGTPRQRELIEAAWSHARAGTLDRIEWDHRAMGEVFAWRLPRQPWQSVRLGNCGVETFRAVMLGDGWWKLVGDALHVGVLSRPPKTRMLRFELRQAATKLRVLAEVAHAIDSLSILGRYCVDSRMRRRATFPDLVREIWLWMGLISVQEARAYAPRPFWVEAAIDGALLKFVSHPGVSPGGTSQQREVIESAWAMARAGALDRIEWDHRAMGEVFAWQTPGRTWQSVRLGTSGVESFRAVSSSDGWWALAGRAVLSGTPARPATTKVSPVRVARAPADTGWKGRLGAFVEVASTLRGLQSIIAYFGSRRMRSQVKFRPFVRELWLWTALGRVQSARSQTPVQFWVESKREGTLIKLTSHRGTPTAGTSLPRQGTGSGMERSQTDDAIRIEWDHRELGEIFTWSSPGRPTRSVKLEHGGVEVFRAIALMQWTWKDLLQWGLPLDDRESDSGSSIPILQLDSEQEPLAQAEDNAERVRRARRAGPGAGGAQTALAQRITR